MTDIVEDDGPAYAIVELPIALLDEALDRDRATVIEAMHTLWLSSCVIDPATAVRVRTDDQDGEPTHYRWGNVRLDNLEAFEAFSDVVDEVATGPYVDQGDDL